jgi:hypothetical protein
MAVLAVAVGPLVPAGHGRSDRDGFGSGQRRPVHGLGQVCSHLGFNWVLFALISHLFFLSAMK